VVSTAGGQVRAKDVVIATGGYTGALEPRLKRGYLPIATYVMLTKPNEALIAHAIRTTAGIGDGRRAGDYYRLVTGERTCGAARSPRGRPAAPAGGSAAPAGSSPPRAGHRRCPPWCGSRGRSAPHSASSASHRCDRQIAAFQAGFERAGIAAGRDHHVLGPHLAARRWRPPSRTLLPRALAGEVSNRRPPSRSISRAKARA